MSEKWNNHFSMMGGAVHTASFHYPYIKSVINQSEERIDNERFRRPSKQLPLPNEFAFEDFVKEDDKPPLITTVFQSPEDVVKAYFGILRNASNMAGYLGGCGSIGDSLQPYFYAYELYSPAAQEKMGVLQNTPKKRRSNLPEKGWQLRLFALKFSCDKNSKALRA